MTFRVIGIGNSMRRDDGAGPAVVQALREMNLEHVELREESGEGASLTHAWSGAENVVVVDAAATGSEPGSVHRFDAAAQPLPSAFFHYSTHAFSLAEAVELARVMRNLPRNMLVYGIEGLDFEHGQGLSDAVAIAARATAHEIAALIDSALCGRAPDPGRSRETGP